MTAVRTLLACGALAGPVFVIVGFGQAFTRQGFDVTRHPLSVLSNGDLGWIQVANFLVSGLLVVAGAVGMRQVLRPGRAATWGPLLVAGYGVGLVAAAIFRADPMDGFPPGTPPGPPAAISTFGLLHFVAAAIAFFSLIAACFVFARRFGALGERGWAAYSAATGLIFFAAFAGNAAAGGQAALNVAFAVAVVLAWAWLSAMALRLMGEAASRQTLA